jgi:hypothetical protein
MPPVRGTCQKCGAAVYTVKMLIGDVPRDLDGSKRVEIIHKIKEDIWVSSYGYLPHVCGQK